MVLDQPPTLQLDIYDHAVIVTRRKGNTWTSYPVTPTAIAQALGKVPSSSGLLPERTLGAGFVQGLAFYVVYVPPRPITVLLADGLDSREQPLVTPPLVWAGCGTAYHIYALAEEGYPASDDSPLQHAPFPNINLNGAICWGTTDARPVAGPQTMERALRLFLEGSHFNQHLAGGKSQTQQTNILLAYPGLDHDTPYPLHDLVPAGRTLSWLVDGAAWGGR